MKNINSTDKLRNHIVALEIKQATDWIHLKRNLYETTENINPFNLIKNKAKEALNLGNLNQNLLTTSIEIGTNYIQRHLIHKSGNNTIVKFAIAILSVGISTIAANHSKEINRAGNIAVNFIGIILIGIAPKRK
jgi:hypothetical protein